MAAGPVPAGSRPAFVPASLDPSDVSQLQPLFQQLLDRGIDSPAALEQWLLDYSALSEAVSEYGARRQIDQSCHTDDPAIEKVFLHWVEQVQPKIKPLHFALQKKYLASPHRRQGPLATPAMAVLDREWEQEVSLFRAENIPLQTQITKLTSAFDKLCGAMLVNFRGSTCTLQQLARFQEDTDRTTRQQAWETGETRRAQDREALDGIFDPLLTHRQQVASNAGCSDYRDYVWKSYSRFDYTPADCHAFADAIEKTCLPLVEALDDRRRHALGVSVLRPFDARVDVRGRGPLRPFEETDITGFLQKTAAIFDHLSPELGSSFRQLQPGRNLDLESRRGKRPGGYQSSLEQSREPFIFMNAAGLQRDVETMLHEAGHAFHYMAGKTLPLLFTRHAPIEFCEVASMSMELLGEDHLTEFYSPEDAARAKRQHLEDIIRLLPWIATIDQFQHWLYTHPGHSVKERGNAWLAVHRRFSSRHVDWSLYEGLRRSWWQRQIHLFSYPFYYIEYGIAQLGALGVWNNFRRDPVDALAKLRAAFALGGTRPLPELFTAAGVPFAFSADTLAPLMQTLGEEVAKLPA